MLDFAYRTTIEYIRAKGYKYNCADSVNPKMVTYTNRLATEIYHGKTSFTSFKDFEFKGEYPFKDLKLGGEKFGVEDGSSAYLIDLSLPAKKPFPKMPDTSDVNQ